METLAHFLLFQTTQLGHARPPTGVTGSDVRLQGAEGPKEHALHLVSRPQETGKQKLLFHTDLLNHLL